MGFKNGEKFVVDSGTTNHMVNSERLLENIRKLEEPVRIRVGNGSEAVGVSIGVSFGMYSMFQLLLAI